MKKKNWRSFFHLSAAVLMCISSLFPAVPLWTVPVNAGQNSAAVESFSVAESLEKYDSIPGLSGKILYDTDGRSVMACGGEVHQFTENGVTKWYWFGENFDFSGSSQNTARGIHLYSSTDLYNWTREEDILKGMSSKDQFETDAYFKALYGSLSGSEKDIVFECLNNCPTAHPKLLYNKKNQQYVMWAPGYSGKQCIFTSNSIKGPFKFVKYCESISGFVCTYIEDNGSAYIIYQEEDDLFTAKLTDDYMGIDGRAQAVSFSGGTKLSCAEGGMFKQNGNYYMLNGRTKQYAMTDSLTGTWTVHPLRLCDNAGQTSEIGDGTYDLSTTSHILPVNTDEGMTYINISDFWDCETEQAKYIWLPVKFSEDGTISLRKLSSWKLDNIAAEEPDNPEEPDRYSSIDGLSGEILYDTEGRRVMACGGEVHQVNENGTPKWYWFGVNDLEEDGQQKYPGIHLYSSTDLYNWDYEGRMENFGNDISIAHPKVLYNEQEQQYVMWVEVDHTGMKAAVSKSIKGPFTIVDGAGAENISGFINLYKDTDGTAYIIYDSRNTFMPESDGLTIARLSADYTKTVGSPQPFQYTDSSTLFNSEGGIFERNGKYYIINAGNPDRDGPQYAVADSINGPWTVHNIQMWNNEKQTFEDIVNKNQTSSVFHVKTETIDTYVCIGDNVAGENPTEIRYIWLPVKFFDDGTAALEKRSNWKLEPENTDSNIEVTEIKLADTYKTMKVGEKYQITASVVPANAADQTLTYRSSYDSVAFVSGTGEVEARKAGTVVILISSSNGKTARLLVTVEPAPETASPVPETVKDTFVPEKKTEVQKVLVSTNKITMGVGEKVSMEASVSPNNASDKTLTYKPSNNKVKVDKQGRITAQNAGTCKITISSSNHKKAVVTVTIKKKPGKISLNAKKKLLKTGEKFQIKTKLPSGTASCKITYTSNKKSVASVSPTGKVTALKKGNAVITVKTFNGKKAVLKIRVK